MDYGLFVHADKIARWLVEHYPPAKQWDDPIGYCAWYLSNGFMATLLTEEEEIKALASARPVATPGDGSVPYRFDHEGDCIFIDVVVIKDIPLGLPAFSAILKERFGIRKRIAYFRRHEERIRVHDFERFIKALDRKGMILELTSPLDAVQK